MAAGTTLPDRGWGSALFADVSGFTALTASLTRLAGPRRGSEETSRHVNHVYDAIIAAVHACRGSVIGFAGDAITCWFDADDGRRAVSCALAMQRAMRRFADLPVLPAHDATPGAAPGPTVTLSVKVCVATGAVRRFAVGDPSIQLLDVLAGETVARLALLDGHAGKGQVVVDDATLAGLGGPGGPGPWRHAPIGDGVHAVTAGGPDDVAAGWAGPPVGGDHDGEPPDRPHRDGPPLDEEPLRSWLLPTVHRRLRAGRGEFLTELRPVAALFLRFGGIDYDADPAAGRKLDAFVRWVQAEAVRYEGALLQLTTGDKGSYLYLAFGAPVSHEDDPERCGAAALRLQRLPPELGYVELLGVGLGYGVMRTGAYGTASRRTYGALGNETNLAARLMTHARGGAIVASEAFHRAALESFVWEALPEALVKGRTEPMAVFGLREARRLPTQEMAIDRDALPLVGRRAELADLQARLDRARAGHGQLVAVVAEAGLGKSRLIAQAVKAAAADGVTVLAGACQAFDASAPYRVWHPVFQALLGIDPAHDPRRQAAQAGAGLRALDPTLEPRLPLLGPVLDLALPENHLTRSLGAELRAPSREALLVDLLRAHARRLGPRGSALLVVLEDLHWIDALSRELLLAVGRVAHELPLLLLTSRRPPDERHAGLDPGWGNLEVEELHLRNFTAREARRLVDLKLERARGAGAVPPPGDVLDSLVERSEGNPYFLEELLADLLERASSGEVPIRAGQVAWPTSLHGLILGRIDRLSEDQQAALKVASVIGRLFPFGWLHGCMPSRPAEALRTDLDALQRLDLTPQDTSEPLTFMFKHAITRDVSYDSLPYGLRAGLHERLAAFLEGQDAGSGEQHLGLLAFHYEQSENLGQKRRYLRLAGEAAQASFANDAALDYYGRLLRVVAPDERRAVLRRAGDVAALAGRYAEAEARYREALAGAEAAADERAAVRFRRLLGELFELQGNHKEALAWLEAARAASRSTGDEAELAAILLALGGNVLWHQGAYEAARTQLEEAVELGRRLRDPRITARALHGLANIDLYQGDRTAARERFERSLAIRREVGDEQGVANALNNLGILAANDGDAPAARELFRQSLAVRRTMGDRSGVAVALNNLGFMAADQGDTDEAQALFEQSLALRRDLGDKLGMAVSLKNLADLARGRDQAGEAGRLYRESLGLAHGIGNQREVAAALMGLAALALRSQAIPRALRLASAAEALLASIGAAMEPELRAAHDAVLAAATAALEPAELDAGRRHGQAMHLAGAVSYALAEPAAVRPA